MEGLCLVSGMKGQWWTLERQEDFGLQAGRCWWRRHQAACVPPPLLSFPPQQATAAGVTPYGDTLFGGLSWRAEAGVHRPAQPSGYNFGTGYRGDCGITVFPSPHPCSDISVNWSMGVGARRPQYGAQGTRDKPLSLALPTVGSELTTCIAST